MKKNNKKSKNTWFIKVRGSYLPNNAAGWLTYIPFLAFLFATAVVAVRETDTMLLAALFIMPNWVAASVVMTYVASNKS